MLRVDQRLSESPIAYWSALCDYWQPWNLTVVEHDVQARPNIFAEFDECLKSPGATSTTATTPKRTLRRGAGASSAALRFRKELIEAAPSAVTDIEPRHRDWHYMSTGLGQNLRAAGFKPHIHSVVNHHRMMDLREAGLFV